MKKLILLTPFIFISTLYAVQVGGPGHDNGEFGTSITPQGGGGGGASVWRKNGDDTYLDSGNVGIKTTTPEGILDAKDTQAQFLVDDDGYATPIYKKVDGNEMVVMSYSGEDNGAIQLKSGGEAKIHFEAASTAKNYISVGDFGIGTKTPESKFHLTGGAENTGSENVITTEITNEIATTNNAFKKVQVGAWLVANGQSVKVEKKIDDNTLIVDKFVNWNNKGEGFPFIYNNPVLKISNEKFDLLNINAKGDVGIGVSNPRQKVHFVGVRGIKNLIADSDDGEGILCQEGEEKVAVSEFGLQPGFIFDDKEILSVGEGYICVPDNSIFWAAGTSKFWYNPETQFVITESANFGIGTVRPEARFEIKGARVSNGSEKLITAGEDTTVTTTNGAFAGVVLGAEIMVDGTTRFVIDKTDDNNLTIDAPIDWNNQGEGHDFTYKNPLLKIADGNDTRLIMRSDGHIGIGTTNPGSRKMKIVGDFEVTGSCSGCGSDRNLKKDIEPLEGALGKVLLMQGINFGWDDNTEEAQYYPGNQLGVDAQDLEDIYPELVGIDSRGYKFVHYKKLVVPLIEAIKEQQKQINHLRRRVRKLDNLDNIEEGWVKVCHHPRRRKGGKNKKRTILIPEEALEAHLARGNKLGPCKKD